VIKGAPWSFAVVASVIAVSMFTGFRFWFRQNLDLKNDLIATYQNRYGPLVGAPRADSATSPLPLIKSWDGYKKTEVVGKVFRNERVPVDGMSYVNCRFSNVTFVYNATAPFSFIGGEVSGPVSLHNDNAPMQSAMEFLRAFHVIREDMQFEDGSTIRPLPIRPAGAPPFKPLGGLQFK